MKLQSLMKDTVFIEKSDSSRIGPFKTAVSGGPAIIFDSELDVNDGEFLIRPLPNGKEEKYLILSAEYRPGLAHPITHKSPPPKLQPIWVSTQGDGGGTGR